MDENIWNVTAASRILGGKKIIYTEGDNNLSYSRNIEKQLFEIKQ